MAIIKCKVCGGDMNISEDKTFGVCEYCGSSMTLPKVNDEQRAAAFNRGNHFRRIGEFDKALAVYERIVAENNTDAEAHWCCALCRFGIEYVEDPATYEWLPTCHRASFDSFLEDVDYLAAVEYSDGITRRQYQKDAVKIAEVQRGILATSQKEEPFDVFICYKESDENGQRTVDSTLAQDIYYQLTDKGRRVFFSRITLEDKGGAEYESYIFAALNSAKVMVVVGTTAENLSAVWVKNEWSRFLSLMKKDHTKLLLPCYRDMDPYDLPDQLSVLQSYDMGKIGFIQDLLRGIDKVLDVGKVTETKKKKVVTPGDSGGSIAALLKRGNIALEDGDWIGAIEFFERVLDIDPDCAEAYLGKALAVANVPSLIKLKDMFLPVLEQVKPNQIKVDILEYEKCEEKLVLENEIPGYLEKKGLQNVCAFNFYYESRAIGYAQQMERSLQRLAENKNLSRAEKYADGELKAEITSFKNEIKEKMEQTLQTVREKDAQSEEAIREQYEQAFPEWKKKIAKMRMFAEACRKEDYQEAISLFESQEYVRAAEIFKKLSTYEDALERLYECAKSLQGMGDEANAAIIYGKAGRYEDAFQRSLDLWKSITKRDAIVLRYGCSIGIKSDGTVVATGNNEYRQCDVAGWENIVAISNGKGHTIGLKSDGTVVATGNNKYGQCDVAGWESIVAIRAAEEHTIGLKSDGTVVATGNNRYGQCNVTGWENIVDICTDYVHTVGLKSDGTVVVVGRLSDSYSIDGWRDIVAICHTPADFKVGLKSNGTVEVAGNNRLALATEKWRNIVAISVEYQSFVIGLKSDGTVEVAECPELYKNINMKQWRDIVAISRAGKNALGLKSDGTVVAFGIDFFWKYRIKISKWKDIVAVFTDGNVAIGLKSDGTVVTVGDTTSATRDISGWTNIKVQSNIQVLKSDSDKTQKRTWSFLPGRGDYV